MSAPSETCSFTALEDRLLRGGTAPRHVRRYLRELAEHLADLTAGQRAAGHDAETAAIRARALLGEDAELAAAMENQPGFRSLAARFPWAVFSLAPLLVMIAGTALPVLLVGGLGKLAMLLSLIQRGSVEPAWLQFSIRMLMGGGTLLAMPLAVLLMAVIAWRQRLSPLWLLLSLAVLWPLLLCASAEFPATAEIAHRQGASLSVGAGFSTSGGFADAGNLLLPAARALALLPLGWLLLRRRAMAVRG